MTNTVANAEKLVGREPAIVKNESKAYGYNYSSLADIAKQGFAIPKMRIARHEGEDYMEYFDGGEWQLGARIVVPEMKGMNAAQAYGSALTYARRYTTQMALALACDDDSKLENVAPANSGKPMPNKFDFQECRKKVREAQSIDELNKLYEQVPEKLKQYVIADFTKRKGDLV